MSRTLPTPFSRWGDYGRYFEVPGGDFEGSLSGWTLRNGAIPAYGNDSYRIGSQYDQRSLLLPAYSSVTTPSICVTVLSPDLRFAVLRLGGVDTKLEVDLNYTDDKGVSRTQKVATVTGGYGWTLTDSVMFLKPVTSLLKRNGQTNVSFTFVANGSSRPGVWQIDDVWVDPYKST